MSARARTVRCQPITAGFGRARRTGEGRNLCGASVALAGLADATAPFGDKDPVGLSEGRLACPLEYELDAHLPLSHGRRPDGGGPRTPPALG